MAAFGAALPDVDADDEGEADDDRFPVYPENWQTVQVFLGCADCWDVIAGLGGVYYQGLKKTEIESTLRLMQIPDSDKLEIFHNLRVMAAAAKEVLNERE